MAGRWLLTIVVRANGSVQEAQVERAEFYDEEMARCLRRLVKPTRFAAAREGRIFWAVISLHRAGATGTAQVLDPDSDELAGAEALSCDADADLARCKAACRRGSARACLYAGLHELNCRPAEQGYGASCRERPDDPGPALVSLARGCELNSVPSCIFAAEAARTPPMLDMAAISRFVSKACALGGHAGCNWLGYLYARGMGVNKDLPRALELFREACKDGNGIACSNAGRALQWGLGAKQDAAQALAYDRRACDLAPTACHRLAWHYATGKGVSKDPKHALELREASCRAGSARGCDGLAWQMFLGEGTARDLARARELWEQACVLSERRECDGSGVLYAEGVGVPKDLAQADALCKPMCEGDEKRGCACLGYVEALDPGRRQQGLLRLREACTLADDAWACAKLRELDPPASE